MLSASGCCCPCRLHNHLMNRCFLPVFGRLFFSLSSSRINETLSAVRTMPTTVFSRIFFCVVWTLDRCCRAPIAFLHPMKNTTIILNRDKRKMKKKIFMFERGHFPCARVSEFWTRCTFENGHKNGQNDMPGVGWMARKIKNQTPTNQHDKFNGKSKCCVAKDWTMLHSRGERLVRNVAPRDELKRFTSLPDTYYAIYGNKMIDETISSLLSIFFSFCFVSLVDDAWSDESSIQNAVSWFSVVRYYIVGESSGGRKNFNEWKRKEHRRIVFKIAGKDVVKTWYRNLRALNNRRCTSSHSDVFIFLIRRKIVAFLFQLEYFCWPLSSLGPVSAEANNNFSIFALDTTVSPCAIIAVVACELSSIRLTPSIFCVGNTTDPSGWNAP